MTTSRAFEAIGKKLASHLDGFVVKGPLMAICPIGHVLRGLYFEPSAFDSESFYVSVFFQPLLVPSKVIGLNMGRRLPGPWNANDPDLIQRLLVVVTQDALPFLERVGTLRGAAEMAEQMAKASKDLYALQAAAYLATLAGDTAGAREALERLLQILDTKVPWQREMAARAKMLLQQTIEGHPHAICWLEGWEKETAANLGIVELCQVG
jgi:hypothetical protein